MRTQPQIDVEPILTARLGPLARLCDSVRWQLTYFYDDLDCWFREKTDVEVLRNNGYVAVLQLGSGDTIEVRRKNSSLTQEEFLKKYVVGHVLEMGFGSWCVASFLTFIADRMIDTYAILNRVLRWMGFPTDEIE